LSKPSTIRIMQFILYFKLAIFLISVGSLLVNLDEFKAQQSGTIIFTICFVVVSLVTMIYMIALIKQRKYWPTLLVSFLVLFCGLLANQMQMTLSVVLIVMLFLKQTKDYFNGSYVEPARKASTQATEAEGEEESIAVSDEPDEAPAVPLAKLKKDPEVYIREATADDADTIYSLMMMAFEEYRTATPPSSALEETEESVLQALRDGSESAAILYEDDTATAMVRFKYDGEAIYFFRLSVVPHRRRRGYAKQLIKWIEKQGVSKGLTLSRCKVRQSVQNNLMLYQDMGYEIVDQELVVRPTGTVKALTMEKKLWE